MSTAPIIDSFSTSQVTLSWVLTSDGGSPIFGFKVFRNDKINGGQTLVYDGSKVPTIATFHDTKVEIENQYTYQVLAINKVGSSNLSPESVRVVPSQKPGKAFAPVYQGSTSTTISLSFEAIQNNGGLPINHYLIYRDDGNSDFSAQISYQTYLLQYTVDKAVDTTLVTGTIYSFYVVAVNSLGEGIPSDIVKIGLGNLPSSPAAPQVDLSQSTTTSQMIYWSALTSQDLPVIGYQLYQRQTNGFDDYQLIYEGRYSLQFNATNLISNQLYSFKLVAQNFNGYGSESSDFVSLICLPPSIIELPQFVKSTKTEIELEWTPP